MFIFNKIFRLSSIEVYAVLQFRSHRYLFPTRKSFGTKVSRYISVLLTVKHSRAHAAPATFHGSHSAQFNLLSRRLYTHQVSPFYISSHLSINREFNDLKPQLCVQIRYYFNQCIVCVRVLCYLVHGMAIKQIFTGNIVAFGFRTSIFSCAVEYSTSALQYLVSDKNRVLGTINIPISNVCEVYFRFVSVQADADLLMRLSLTFSLTTTRLKTNNDILHNFIE